MIINDYENTHMANVFSEMYKKAYDTLRKKYKFDKELINNLKNYASFDDIVKLLDYKNNL